MTDMRPRREPRSGPRWRRVLFGVVLVAAIAVVTVLAFLSQYGHLSWWAVVISGVAALAVVLVMGFWPDGRQQ